MAVDDLTRAEARERASMLAVDAYEVVLDLTDGAGAPGPADGGFSSRTTVRFRAEGSGASTFCELDALEVRSVRLDGQELGADVYDRGTRRLLLGGLSGGHVLEVDAQLPYSTSGEGLHRFHDPVDGAVYLYTQFETYDAHRVYACFDQPDLKATFRLEVTAPADWRVLSNAAQDPEPAPAAGGARRHQFAPTPRVSTYITAVVAGPYAEVRRTLHSGGLEIDGGWLCRATLADHLEADDLFDVTQKGFDFFHDHFARPYAFGPSYDQVFVPEFNAGAMENAGCVTYLEDYVFRSRVTDFARERRAETVLHEMAHMWFGDLVTMVWWDDLWLNESFATWASVFCQAEATRWTQAWTTFANVEKTWALRADQLPSTHPVAADIPDIAAVDVNFDGITYAKGASVLKHLVAWVGQEAFLSGVRAYFQRHAFGSTTFDDLLHELEAASGRDLGSWAKAWLQTAGVNTLRPLVAVDADGVYTSVAVAQEAPAGEPTLRPHRVALGLYDRGEQGLVRRERVELDLTGARTEVAELVGHRQPDLLLVNDDDLTYVKLRLDERSWETVRTSLADVAESLPRALCLATAWDMTRDAEVPAREYLELVAGVLPREQDIGVASTLLRQVSSAALLFSADSRRAAALGTVAATARGLLDAAPAGSDHQLAAMRTLATAARSDADLDVLAGLLSGAAPLDGLAVDTDLRWTLLSALCARGRAGEADVAAELDRDDTATGRRHAAGARASLPDAQAKERAWVDAVETDALPNAVQGAVLAGFWQPDQGDLLAPYEDRYFAVVGDVWRERSSETAQRVVSGAYPSLFPSETLADRTEDWVAQHDPPAALGRLLAEAADGVRRALAARGRDART